MVYSWSSMQWGWLFNYGKASPANPLILHQEKNLKKRLTFGQLVLY